VEAGLIKDVCYHCDIIPLTCPESSTRLMVRGEWMQDLCWIDELYTF